MSQRSVILATASYDRTIRFWKARSGSCYRTIYYPALPQRELLPVENQNNQNKPQHVNRLEISPNKCHLAAACNPYIRLFDVNFSRAHVRTFVSHTRNVTAVGFYSDGNSLYSGSEDGTVKIWDLRAPNRNEDYEWNCRKTCHSHGSVIPINTVALHPNQIELISGDQNGSIRILDTRMNMCRLELVPEAGTAIRSLSVMWDGKMMVAANDRGTCYIWSVSPGTGQALTEFEPHQRLQAHNSQILKCALSPESIYLATASSDKTVKIWNVGDFTLHRVLTGHERWVWDCAFSVDAKFLVSASSDMTARLWLMETGIEMQVYRGHHRATVCCALSD